MSAELEAIVQRLAEQSRKAAAAPALAWPDALGGELWCMSPELLSVHGTAAAAAMDEAALRRLARWEACNFFSLNIHGERLLMEGLAHRLHRRATADVSPYLHHFLGEENRHMEYFAGYCLRYGRIYPDLHVAVPRAHAPGEEDFLFFARVMAFEEIVDVYNVRMMGDARLHPIVRDINRLHHLDEARHLVFGRQYVRELWRQHSPTWPPEVVARVRAELAAFLAATWREYYNPAAYRDAGLADPSGWREKAWSDPAQQAHRRSVGARLTASLLAAGILLEDPTP